MLGVQQAGSAAGGSQRQTSPDTRRNRAGGTRRPPARLGNPFKPQQPARRELLEEHEGGAGGDVNDEEFFGLAVAGRQAANERGKRNYSLL